MILGVRRFGIAIVVLGIIVIVAVALKLWLA